MTRIELRFLGSFQVAVAGVPLTRFRSDKVRALLAFLATEADRPHSRASLCGLFWPEQPDEAASQNLSQSLLRLREALGEARGGASALRVSRQSIQWEANEDRWLDAAEFARRAASPDIAGLERAAELYQGELLAGFSLPGCATFEEWLLLTRERFARMALSALETLAEASLAAGRFEPAEHYAHRQLVLDPWRELAHRQLMRALAGRGDRSGAAAAYARCCRILRDELGIEPDPATSALAEQIRTLSYSDISALNSPAYVRPLAAPERAAYASHASPEHAELRVQNSTLNTQHSHTLPAPLIGRAAELAELTELLHAPDTRLLTIVGAGGMGKTHLAIELARANQQRFADGACFVALAPLASADELPTALLHALDLPPPQSDPAALLLQALRDKQLLLVLDNAEHVLDIADLAARLLQAAPRLRIVATSRERLNLRGEQRYPIGGLAYEPGAPDADAGELPAVRLFVQSARRVQPRFQPAAGEIADVLRICRLVLGMPLGLELAAAWVELLPLEAIAAQIARSGDFLATELRDLPERQRSMRAVFDWSWRLLREDEQHVFRQLSVFRGGFTLEAAPAVAGATPTMLLRLVGKSLVQGSSGRYEVHELLRQFAHQQLDAAQAGAEAERRHSQFYLAYVAERERRLFRDQPAQAAAEIRRELDNIRQAWRWAAAHAHAGELGRSMHSLALFSKLAGAASEWEPLFELAVTRLQEDLEATPDDAALREALGMLLALLGSACIQQGKHAQALRWAEQAIELAAAGGVGQIYGLLVLGQALRRQGQSDRAREALEQTAALARQAQRGGSSHEQLPDAEFTAYNWLCSIALSNDEYTAAFQYVERGLQLCRRLGKALGVMILESDLLDIALATGDYAAARHHGVETLRLTRELGYRRIEAATLCNLSSLARLRGAYMLAQELAAQALACFRAMGDSVGEAVACTESGYLRLLLGDYAGAQGWLDRALASLRVADMPAREMQQTTLRLAQLAHARGDAAPALSYATQAVAMARELDGTSSQAQALAVLGLVYAQQGQLQLAAEAYQQALACAGGRGGAHLRAIPHAGLAELALAGGDLAAAQTYVEALLHTLIAQPAQLDEPFGVYLTCHRVLAARQDARSETLLQQARRQLDEYAGQIADPALRQSFRAHVASHHALIGN